MSTDSDHTVYGHSKDEFSQIITRIVQYEFKDENDHSKVKPWILTKALRSVLDLNFRYASRKKLKAGLEYGVLALKSQALFQADPEKLTSVEQEYQEALKAEYKDDFSDAQKRQYSSIC